MCHVTTTVLLWLAWSPTGSGPVGLLGQIFLAPTADVFADLVLPLSPSSASPFHPEIRIDTTSIVALPRKKFPGLLPDVLCSEVTEPTFVSENHVMYQCRLHTPKIS